MKHAISWFEIPAIDIDRAQKFYEALFDVKLVHMDFGNTKMRAFPLDDPMEGVGGTIIDSGGFHKPRLCIRKLKSPVFLTDNIKQAIEPYSFFSHCRYVKCCFACVFCYPTS
jgi:predicted enzyme related to lactoylglutathione lyase